MQQLPSLRTSCPACVLRCLSTSCPNSSKHGSPLRLNQQQQYHYWYGSEAAHYQASVVPSVSRDSGKSPPHYNLTGGEGYAPPIHPLTPPMICPYLCDPSYARRICLATDIPLSATSVVHLISGKGEFRNSYRARGNHRPHPPHAATRLYVPVLIHSFRVCHLALLSIHQSTRFRQRAKKYWYTPIPRHI